MCAVRGFVTVRLFRPDQVSTIRSCSKECHKAPFSVLLSAYRSLVSTCLDQRPHSLTVRHRPMSTDCLPLFAGVPGELIRQCVDVHLLSCQLSVEKVFDGSFSPSVSPFLSPSPSSLSLSVTEVAPIRGLRSAGIAAFQIVFSDATILHMVDMTQPPQSAMSEQNRA